MRREVTTSEEGTVEPVKDAAAEQAEEMPFPAEVVLFDPVPEDMPSEHAGLPRPNCKISVEVT